MCRKNLFTRAHLGIAASFLTALLTTAHAQTASPVALPDSTNPVAAPPAVGPVDQHKPYISRATLKPEESAATMTFEVALKMRNFAELKARVGKREHVPLAEMAAKYEPLAADYKTVLDWLTGEGFTIVRQDSHHMAIFVSGTVSQIAQATHTNFARVTSEGKEYTSAVTAPRVPANIAPLLIGINGLQPHIHAHRHLIKQQVQPNASSGSAAYVPSQIAQAYNATGLYSTNLTGAGQTIAIVIDTFPSTSDLIQFWSLTGIKQSINNIKFIQVVAGTLPSPSGEETLDTEWSSSIAPGAKVRVYAVQDSNLPPADLDQAYQQIIDDATTYGIHQMSMSYGVGEADVGQAQVDTDDAKFVMLANLGVTVFASSGDEGPTPDGDDTVQVESPASDPYVTGVGGTSLTLDANNNESTEVVWNDSEGASGGGASRYFAHSTCPWQAVNGVAIGAMREVPDISCSADPNYGAYVYLGGAFTVYGGTSWASPTCAAFCALFNQERSVMGLASLGQLGPYLYPQSGTANFREITSGNNDTQGNNGFSANANGTYNEATGIGVPLAQALTETLAGTQTLVSPPPGVVTVNQGQNATITVTTTGTPVSYQWQRMAIGTSTFTTSSLSNPSVYSGTTSATLTVYGTTTAMSGDQFQCVVTYNGTGTVTSAQPTALIVENPWIISTLAGTAGTAGLVNNPTTGTAAEFDYPTGIAVDSSGNIYVADLDNNVIREVTPAGVVTTPYGSPTRVAGTTNGVGNNGTGTKALFDEPRDIAIDSSGNLYVSDEGSNHIRKISASASPGQGQVTTISASASPPFNGPKGICVDSSGNVYVADAGNNVIREIAASNGAVTIVAGSSSLTAGFANGPATNGALFNEPLGIAIDGSGNLYVTEYYNEVIRKISGGVVSTLAGQAGVSGCLDGALNGSVSQALFNVPRGIMVDSAGNLYVTDSFAPVVTQNQPTFTGNNLLRMITPAGVVTTLAGQAGIAGTANGTGDTAQFYNPCGLAMNSSGAIYLADASNNTIRVAQLETAVSIVATQPTATAFTQAQGLFTVTRTGPTTSSLTVNYSVAGSAVPNTDYTALPESESLTIPVGSTAAAIMVDPKVDTAVTNPTVQLTLDTSVSYNLGSPTTATVTIQEPTAYQAWKLTNFGTNAATLSNASDTADPNNNGVPNLLEYAFHSNPNQAGTNPLPTISTVESGGQNYLAITYTQLQSSTDPNLTYTVQVTSDLTQQTDTWHSGSTYTTLFSQGSNPDGSGTLITTVRDNTALSSTTMRFIRVQVSDF